MYPASERSFGPQELAVVEPNFYQHFQRSAGEATLGLGLVSRTPLLAEGVHRLSVTASASAFGL